MINAFCATGGWSNDWISWAIGAWRQPPPIESPTGVLGAMSGSRLNTAVEGLRDRGYALYPSALDPATCDRLMEFALSTPARLRPMDGQKLQNERVTLFDPARAGVVRYDYPLESLLANEDIQRLMADGSLLALSQAYLGTSPRADVLSMWWHTNFKREADAEAAQFYHFDMDRLRWVKVFIYLTDVGPDNGPHAFVRGSHRRGGIPRGLLRRGYVRLDDKDVQANFSADSLLEFVAPRGTILVEDTRGLHKGLPVRGEPRLMLQLQFSNALFGASYPSAKLPTRVVGPLAERLRTRPECYAAYR